MKSFKLLLLVAAAAGFAACSSDDDESMPGGQEPKSTLPPLTIEVAENPMVNPEAPARMADGRLLSEDDSETRAPITTTSLLSGFKIDYMYGVSSSAGGTPITATKSSEGKWTSSGTWPTTDYTVDWYAHSYGTFCQTEDANKYPYIHFSSEENSNAQIDLLVAKTSVKYSDTKEGNVTFTFDHACTALRFYVKKANNLSDYTLNITEVKLCNVIDEGDYYYGTSSWTLGSHLSSYTLYNGSGMTLGTTDYVVLGASDAPYLFLIPQTLTEWKPTESLSNTYLELTCAITKEGFAGFSGTAYIPFGATLAAGNKHDVKINIGKNSLYKSANTKVIPSEQ